MRKALVSKAGIGYALYDTQVFNLALVMTGIMLILVISFIIYQVITLLERKNH